MRKRILVGMLFGSVSSACFAQGSVTLYGIIDEGLNFSSNSGGSKQVFLSDGELQGSRFGLRGSEQLGGGLSSVFVIENGFNINNGKLGQGGLGFGRQVFVGMSAPLGTATLGRQYDSVGDYVGPLGAGEQWGGAFAAHPGDNDNLNMTYRINNAVKFTSPSLEGLRFGGLYSFGGFAGDFTRNQIWSVGASYSHGPVALAAAYLDIRNPNSALFGAGGTVAPSVDGLPGSNLSATPVYSGYASAHSQEVATAGIAYSLGSLTIGTVYSNVRFAGLGNQAIGPVPSGGTSGTAVFNNVELNARYQIQPDFLVGVSFVFTKNGGAAGYSSAYYQQGAIGFDYLISKRTDIYGLSVYQKARGVDSTGQPAVASINSVTPSNSDRQFVSRIAIRHRF